MIAQACGSSDKPHAAEHKPPPVEPEKAREEKVELPPLASPDCAAPPPALSGQRLKVQEADGLRAPATEGLVKLNAGPILGDVTDQT